ncbi:MAG: flotillin family protein [Planctomycetota bacterium]|jgi:flotillin
MHLHQLLALDPTDPVVLLVVFCALLLFSFLLLLIKRYRRCPSNKVLVIYGKVSGQSAARCHHGGGAFVWPLIQDYAYLDLEPIQIEIPLTGALSLENIRVNVPSVFTVAIGTDTATMNNAAIRLLNLLSKDIEGQARDIIFGQLRQVIASMGIEDINRDRDAFLNSIQDSMEPELKKIGLCLINVNITDITDDSGYIEAIGRKAAATAIQQAEIDVAIQVKSGAVGVAQADREKDIQVAIAAKNREIGTKNAEREQVIQVAEYEKEARIGAERAGFERDARIAEADREKRVAIAEANSQAVEGENAAQAVIARTNAELTVERAEAFQKGETKKRVAEAEVLQAQYEAEAIAAGAEGKKIEAEQRAALESLARAEKAKVVVDAEASADKRRIEAEGEAAAIYAKLEAEARGQFEILQKKGQGFAEIVDACGGPQAAFQMLMLEHIDKLSETAATAISNIKFDKVVVWDGGAGSNGNSATSGFLNGLSRSLPPMLNMMRDIGGIDMPEYFGKLIEAEADKETVETTAEAETEADAPKTAA